MWVLDSSPLHRLWATSDVDLELRSLPSPGVTRLRRYYEPLRHPRRPGLALAGLRLAVTRRHRWGFPCCAALRVQACRRQYPGGTADGIGSLPGCPRRRPSLLFRQVGSRITRFEACSAFTHVTACLLAKSPEATLCIEGFGSFVTSTAAPIATGRSESCRVGLAPTEELRLSHGALNNSG